MMTHFNIAKKVEVNPFENVAYVALSEHSSGQNVLKPFLDYHSEEVVTRKVNNTWTIMYQIGLLDFTTLVQWYAPYRGKFHFKNSSIHFRIEEDVMHCW
jgi:hypothetical protein